MTTVTTVTTGVVATVTGTGVVATGTGGGMVGRRLIVVVMVVLNCLMS